MTTDEMRKVIELERHKRAVRKNGPQQEPPDREEIRQAITELASMSELDYQIHKKSKAKELGLTIPALESLVLKQRREESPMEAREFRLDSDGLYRLDDYGEPIERITSAFTVEGLCRSPKGRDYRLMLGIAAPGGEFNQVLLPRCALAGDGKEAVKVLLDAGLRLAQVDGAQRMLLRYLVAVETQQTITMVEQPGWQGETVYVTPSGNYPPEEVSIIYGGTDGVDLDFEQSGTLQEWQRHVAAKAVNNLYLILFLTAAIAGIMLPIMAMTTFIVNLVGDSSSGKTTTLIVGNSPYGSPRRKKSWRTTDNALEGIAAAANHGFLALDEMGMAPPATVKAAPYTLGNEQGKGRANRAGDSRSTKKWSLVVGSTGESTLSDLLRAAGEEPKIGQEVRIIDIVIDGATPHGVFHDLHGAENGAELSADLLEATHCYYGTAAPAFIQRIQQEGFDGVARQATEIVKVFRSKFLPASSNGQVYRVCDRFALLAAAGELASRWGVTGWPENHAMEAIGTVFDSWLGDRGGVGAGEEQKILNQVVYFIEKYGRSRFEPMEPLALGEYRHTPAQRAGYYHEDNDGNTHHFVLAQTFTKEVCEGFNLKRVRKVLHGVGILKDENSSVMKSPEKHSIRVYHLINVIGGGTGSVSDGGYL